MKRVVTAETVEAEHKAGRTRIDAPVHSTVVTPAAWSRARELGVTVATGASHARPPQVRPHEQGAAERHVDPSGVVRVRGSSVQLAHFTAAGADKNVALLDVIGAEQKAPMTAGFMSWRKEDSFAWSLDYDEIDLVLEGVLHIVIPSGTGDRTVEAVAGDVLYVPKGSRITFATPSRVRVFYVTYPANWQG
jgi:ethanolamine utilization protein EutQ